MSDLDDALMALQRAVTLLEEASDVAAERQRNAEIAQALASRLDAALARIDNLLTEGG